MQTQPVSLLIKPAGADCNLNCGYCFYLAKSALYPESTRPRMTLETLEQMYRAYFAIPMPVYSFGWQGGEPTRMGVDFFAEAFAMQRAMAPRGATVSNGLQTNGTLLTPAWARLLREYEVLVGLSIDGPPELHNALRRFADGDGEPFVGPKGDTAGRVTDAAALLRAEKVQFNALTVVGPHNVDHPIAIYDYLRSLRVRHMQFIPLVEPTHSVDPHAWGRFLTAIFRRWFPKDVRRVSIRHHDSILEYLVNGTYNVCTMGTSCGGHLVVEHTGDIYPCDFYVEAPLRLGNVGRASGGENPLVAALSGARNRRFMAQKSTVAAECAACRYRPLCNGDCPRVWRTEGTPRSHLCEGWSAFYDETLGDFLRLSRSVAEMVHGPGATPRIDARAFERPALEMTDVVLHP